VMFIRSMLTISRVQSRCFTIDSEEASALDSGTNFWVRGIMGNRIVVKTPTGLLHMSELCFSQVPQLLII
jgi:hypothetical protein